MIRLLVGLGNPGAEYEDTRHNAGFWWVDDAARRLKASLSSDRAYKGLVGRVNAPIPGIAGVSGPVWLLQPQTYMNLSGQSVGALARFFKITPPEILVVHDELDLLPGQMKIKQGGGSAGHNGLKDITAQLGSPDYWRLRLGIGHPGDRNEVAGYVLRKPPASERGLIEGCIERSLPALEFLLRGEMDRAVRLIHAKPVTEKAPTSKVVAPPVPGTDPAPPPAAA